MIIKTTNSGGICQHRRARTDTKIRHRHDWTDDTRKPISRNVKKQRQNSAKGQHQRSSERDKLTVKGRTNKVSKQLATVCEEQQKQFQKSDKFLNKWDKFQPKLRGTSMKVDKIGPSKKMLKLVHRKKAYRKLIETNLWTELQQELFVASGLRRISYWYILKKISNLSPSKRSMLLQVLLLEKPLNQQHTELLVEQIIHKASQTVGVTLQQNHLTSRNLAIVMVYHRKNDPDPKRNNFNWCDFKLSPYNLPMSYKFSPASLHLGCNIPLTYIK